MDVPIVPAPVYLQPVSVRDVDIPFWSMVAFLIKWAVASIPAVIVLAGLMAIIVAVVAGLFAVLVALAR